MHFDAKISSWCSLYVWYSLCLLEPIDDEDQGILGYHLYYLSKTPGSKQEAGTKMNLLYILAEREAASVYRGFLGARTCTRVTAIGSQPNGMGVISTPNLQLKKQKLIEQIPFSGSHSRIYSLVLIGICCQMWTLLRETSGASDNGNQLRAGG